MNIDWNAKGYQKDFAFVPKYGEAVLDLIDAAPGALAVDLGCGNGGLTGKLIERGYRVVGVDASAPMLALAKERYPDTTFLQADACTFQLPEQADVIFSNAVLHWIDAAKQNELIANIASQLKPGGQLVCEFGGKGCAENVHAALEKIFAAHGLTYRRTFYFPTVGEYAPMLERHGLQVRAALLFDRPTPQQTEDGLADWIRMFDKRRLQACPKNCRRPSSVRLWRHCARCCITMAAGMWTMCASASRQSRRKSKWLLVSLGWRRSARESASGARKRPRG